MGTRFGVVTEGAMDVLVHATPRAERLYLRLTLYANRQGECWPSRQTLMAKTNMDVRDLRRVFRELERLGLVVTRPGVGARGSRYYLPHRDGLVIREGGSLPAEGGSLPLQNKPFEQTKDKEPPIVPQTGDEIPTFEDLWECYPKGQNGKPGKASARKAWAKLKPDLAICQAIDTALEWQVPLWAKDGNQFVPHLATYLNQRRFEDLPPDPVIRRQQRR